MTPAGAVCARHPTSAAVDICARCGSFVCATCEELSESDEVFCSTCFSLRAPRPATTRSYAGRVLVGIGLIVPGLLYVMRWGGLLGWLTFLLGVAGVVLVALEPRRGIRVPKWVWAMTILIIVQTLTLLLGLFFL